jgi:hypothetical protein
MVLQALTIGKQEFVLIAKRDFRKLAQQAGRQSEDDYWIQAALAAEARAKLKREKPVAFEDVERELDATRKLSALSSRTRR